MASANKSPRPAFVLLAVAATAIMVWFGTGLFPQWPLMWFAPLPILLIAARASWPTTALTAFCAWAIGSLNLWHYFTAALHVPLPGRILIVAAPAVVVALAVLLYRALLRRGAVWTALLAFPATWVSFEYIFDLTSVHGTAISLAYSQLGFLPFLQLASVTGPWGISFVMLSFSTALAIGIHLRSTAPAQAVRIVGAAAATVLIVLAFGVVRLAASPQGQLVKVGLVASDTPANSGVASPGADAESRYRNYATQVNALAAQGAKAIVIPENLAVLPDANAPAIDAIFQPTANKNGVTIIVGAGRFASPLRYNEARIYTPDAALQHYEKHHLLPPFESIFTPGTSTVTLPQPNSKWGVAICKDMDFTQLSRSYGQQGAGLLLVPAWDFVLDRASHGHIAIMRGVESGFSIARAARGGYLTVSDSRGRILAEAQSNAAPFATLIADVPDVHQPTLYLLLGDWFAWVVFATLAFVLAQLIRLRSR